MASLVEEDVHQLVCPGGRLCPTNDHARVLRTGFDAEPIKEPLMLMHKVRVVIDPEVSLPSAQADYPTRMPPISLVVTGVELDACAVPLGTMSGRHRR
jgi:hypothetical protein